MQHSLTFEPASGRCLVTVVGAADYDTSAALLTVLWNDPRYAAAPGAIWDISDMEMPEFNELLKLSHFILREKAGRGPRRVAFVAPSFGDNLVARIFRGFEQPGFNYRINFFAGIADAERWLTER